MCWRRMSECITTLNNLETLAVDLISHAALALQHLAALSKLSRLSMPNAYHLSTMALARLTALTALNVAKAQSWVGCCTCLLLAQHKAGMLHQSGWRRTAQHVEYCMFPGLIKVPAYVYGCQEGTAGPLLKGSVYPLRLTGGLL